ncbi:hypothetical protein [Kordiimonas aquimaris]|uniref:hypothetical protein n=1 Tax=Kordiimonas aquimaris TaxID=707591 RepID=UPI0021D3D7D0|nr:hypothetical protein [Kordiimonas aquimaris]
MLRALIVSLAMFIVTPSLTAQPREGVNPLDDRGGLMIPENTEDLRVVSLELWLKFQRTNQRLYNYIREAAEFRAYLHVCKRHDLNVNLRPINKLSARNLQQIILAHYEEPEYAVIEALDRPAQATLMDDIAGDIYAFEYGHRIAELRATITASEQTNQSFCATIADEHFKKYVALLATAKNIFGANSN